MLGMINAASSAESVPEGAELPRAEGDGSESVPDGAELPQLKAEFPEQSQNPCRKVRDREGCWRGGARLVDAAARPSQ